MEKIRYWFDNPAKRRLALVIISGGLILLALAAQRLFGYPDPARGLFTAAALLAGGDIALRAWHALRNRHVSIELLVSVAFIGALAIGEVWEAAAVTFLFVFGAYLEARTLNKTRQALNELMDLAPATALVLRDGRQVETLFNQVEVGEIVLLKPGSRIPVDGVVVSGASAVDESAITGEPIPEEKSAGSQVYAGTVNQLGLLQVRTTGAGADTALARIIRRVEEAQEEKAPTQRFIERFARWYTPAVISLSIGFFLFTRDIHLALTLLVISCPGALVISTPVSIVAGIGRAAKSGILIKGGEYLENAGKISVVALDKTGTLTLGKPTVTDVIPAMETEPIFAEAQATLTVERGGVASGDGHAGWQTDFLSSAENGKWNHAQQEVLSWAIAAEAGSEHPLAGAILAERESLSEGELPLEADRFQAVPGKGVRASENGRQVLLGNLAWIHELGLTLPAELAGPLERLKLEGKTVVVVAAENRVLGLLGISDPLRKSAPEMIRMLHASGVKEIVMLTGDDPVTAQAIARQAGLSQVQAGLLPEDKLQAIRKLQQSGRVVAMVGDGINDAPALAAADIGMAMGAAGAGIAIETADVALMADDLLKIPEAIRLSKATLRNIRQNLLIALATVAVLIIGVMFGKVHMASGMLVHEASVLVVILNGMRLLRI
jgi:Zn2+/Cd2+-exporting ATPase